MPTYDRDVIELDIGGMIFRTTKSTVCRFESYFQGMLSQGNFLEGSTGRSIFVDRDPTTFESILSFMRSGRIFFTQDSVYLEKLLLEADFYCLTSLAEQITEELEARATNPNNVVMSKQQKVVSSHTLQQHLDQGWHFIGTFEDNETSGCTVLGSKVEASWRTNACSICREGMIYEKFLRHTVLFKPTKIVLQRDHHSVSVGTNNCAPVSQTAATSHNPLVFDQSFG